MNPVRRSWEIVGYLFFCSFEVLSAHLPACILKTVGWILFYPFRDLLDHPPPERLRIALERLGPTYLKIGQLLSTRVDILPARFIRELEGLQDRVPPTDVNELLESHAEISKHIESMDPEPIGSGSVAQVHRARLKDGREVAVKMLRPNAEEIIRTDMKILRTTVSLLYPFVKLLRDFQIPKILEEFERMLVEELDLTTEATYMELFRRFSEKEPALYIPEVLWEFTSKNVLVTEFVRGRKLTELKSLTEDERRKLAEKFVNIVHRMIFEQGVFHGDLHPGNIFVTEDNRFVFVDFGIVGRLTPETLSEFFMFSLGVMNKDLELIIGALKEIGAIPEGTKETLLKREILSFLDKYYNRPLSQIDAEKLFYEELSAARRFRIVLPEELLVLMKTIAHTESMARLIYPDFRLPPLLKPYLKKIAPRITTQEVKRRFLRLALEYTKLLENIPKILEDKQKERVKRSETFLGCALLGFAVVLAFAPKLLLVYLPSVLAVKKLQK